MKKGTSTLSEKVSLQKAIDMWQAEHPGKTMEQVDEEKEKAKMERVREHFKDNPLDDNPPM